MSDGKGRNMGSVFPGKFVEWYREFYDQGSIA